MKTFVLAVLVCAAPALADIAPPEKPVEVVVPTPAPPPTPAPAAPQHPQGIEQVPMGVIEGGWGYVYAAYGAGLAGIAGYAASLFLRRPTKART